MLKYTKNHLFIFIILVALSVVRWGMAQDLPDNDPVLTIKLESVDFLGTGIHELTKEGEDGWSNDDFADNGDTPIDYAEWQDIDLNGTATDGDGEKNEPVCYTKGSTPKMTAVLSFSYNVSPGRSAKLRVKNDDTVLATKDITLSGTTISEENLDWGTSVGDVVDNKDYTLTWEVSLDGGTTYSAIGTSTTKFLVTFGPPAGSTLTAKRIDYACELVKTADTKTKCAENVRDGLDQDPGSGGEHEAYDLNAWRFKDSEDTGDCITLAKLAEASLKMIGVDAEARKAYPTIDTSWQSDTCDVVLKADFAYQGETFRARLGYAGNSYEGYFMISDPGIKAYTIEPVSEAFTNQTYYRSQVINSVSSDWFWKWDATVTKNGVTVTEGGEVPGSPHYTPPDFAAD